MRKGGRFGEIAGSTLPRVGPIDGQALGELGFMAVLGLLCLASVARCLLNEPTPSRAGGAAVILLVLAGAFFGVVVDAVHAAATTGTAFEIVVAGIEDGGEMICFTLAGAVAIMLLLADRERLGRRDSAGN